MRRLTTWTALAAGALLAAAGSPASAAEPVALGDSFVFDLPAVDALSDAEERAADERLEQLRQATGIDLWVVFVDDFDAPSDRVAWADAVAQQNGLGTDQYLLAVAVEARQYYISSDLAGPLSEDDLVRIEAAVETPLREGDWAGAVDVAADAVEEETQPGGSGGVAWILGILVVVAAVVVVVWLVRRRARAAAGAGGGAGVPLAELEHRAATALVATDDAVKSSEQELGFAIAQFGEDATGEFHDALESARSDLAKAFELKQRLGDAEPDGEQQARAGYEEILRLCEAAARSLEEKAETFRTLREVEQNAPAALANARRALSAAAGADQRAAAALEALRATYAPEALQEVADNAAQARDRLATAETELTEAELLLAAGDTGEAASAIVVAEQATDQAVALERAVTELGATLAAAERQAGALVAELEGDVARARSLGSAHDAAPAIAATEQAIALARQNLSGQGRRPRVLLQQLQAANEQIDAVIVNGERAQQLLGQTILQARSAVTAAQDFIAARRGGVGADARTRLAEARTSLDRAEAAQSVDVAQALPHAQRALQLAESASQQAQSDVSGMMGGMLGGSGGYGGHGGGRRHRRRDHRWPDRRSALGQRLAPLGRLGRRARRRWLRRRTQWRLRRRSPRRRLRRRTPRRQFGADAAGAAGREVLTCDAAAPHRGRLHAPSISSCARIGAAPRLQRDLHEPTRRSAPSTKGSTMTKQSIFGRISTLIRANVNALIDQAEDPQKMLDQLVRDFTNNIADAEAAIAETIGNLRLLERDHAEDLETAKEWGNKALAASRKADELRAAGNTADAEKFDNLAKVALQRQIAEENDAKAVAPQIAAQTEVVEKLKSGLDGMKSKLEDLKSKRSELIARAKTAEAQNKVHDAVKSINVLDPTSDLGRFEEKVRRQEALAAGKAELAASSLDAQFDELQDMGQLTEVEARLAALKSGNTQAITS